MVMEEATAGAEFQGEATADELEAARAVGARAKGVEEVVAEVGATAAGTATC